MSATTKNWIDNQQPDVNAEDVNGFKSENNNLILGSGQPLNTGNNQQTHAAVATYAAVGNYMVGGGSVNAYTANAAPPRVSPPARQQGMVILFEAPAKNTGACSLNAFGTGFVSIKLRGGNDNPAAGDVSNTGLTTVIDRGSYFELVRTGTVKETIVTVSNTSWIPQPDARSIKFVAIGGGGGGGGSQGVSPTQSAAASGGNSGSYCIRTVSSIEQSYNITIGSQGSGGGGGASGGTGGQTSVVSTLVSMTAPGGLGGKPGVVSSGTAIIGVSPPASTKAAGGQLNAAGGASNTSLCVGTNALISGNGGASIVGNGSLWANNTTHSTGNIGSGGHGGLTSGGDGSARPGSPGVSGAVLITEFM